MAFDGGKPFVRVAAGFVRVGAFVTEHTAGGERQDIAEHCAEFFPELQGDILVIAPRLQTGVKIQNIRDLRYRSKEEDMLIPAALVHAVLDWGDRRRTCPGVTVMLTFMFADIPDLVGKDEVLLR